MGIQTQSDAVWQADPALAVTYALQHPLGDNFGVNRKIARIAFYAIGMVALLASAHWWNCSNSVPVKLDEGTFAVKEFHIDGLAVEKDSFSVDIKTGWHRFEVLLDDGTVITKDVFLIIDQFTLYYIVSVAPPGRLVIRQ